MIREPKAGEACSMTSLGIWRRSQEFLRAAEAAAGASRARSPHGPVALPAYFLALRTIEIALKSYLRGAGASRAKLARKLGHDLQRSLDMATRLGIEEIVPITPRDRAVISACSSDYDRKDFEYMIVRGFTLPDYGFVHDFATRLVEGLERYAAERREIEPKMDAGTQRMLQELLDRGFRWGITQAE